MTNYEDGLDGLHGQQSCSDADPRSVLQEKSTQIDIRLKYHDSAEQKPREQGIR